MKTIRNILLIAVIAIIYACENPLDSTRLDVIGNNVVWDDESLVDAYMANMYDRSDLIEANDNSQDPQGRRYGTQSLGGEAFGRDQGGAYGYTAGNLSGINTGVAFPYFGAESWSFIRALNVAIKELSIEDSRLSTKFREQRLGEAYFLRAHAYFRKVIRYGGVPIVDYPQETSLPAEDLRIPRSTEKKTYDFIASDLNKAAVLLANKTATVSRITEPAVWMLMSRAMLYAGSISNNNSLLPLKDINGLVGIDPAEARNYYKLSLEASRKILPAPFGTGNFALRPGQTADEYRKIFNDIGSANDRESILTIQFNGEGGRYNNEGVYLLPRAKPEHVNWGAWQATWMETLEWYEYKNGIPGTMLPDNSATLRSTLASGQYYNLSQLFADKDPRFRASIALPPYKIQGFPAYMHNSVKNTADANQAGIPLRGPTQNRQSSGICVIKTANENNPRVINNIGDAPLVVYRLAEAYLNYAEAAYALGDASGLDALNAIRTRAGMPLRTSLTMPYIMHERKIELAFENHRFWDLRRWRIAQTELSPTEKFKHIQWTWDVANNTFTAILVNEKLVRLFKPEHYYFPIPLSSIENNPALEQNPGYNL